LRIDSQLSTTNPYYSAGANLLSSYRENISLICLLYCNYSSIYFLFCFFIFMSLSLLVKNIM